MVGKRSGKHGVRLKLEELTGQKIEEDDPRLAEIVELLKNKFITGERRYPIRNDEFKQYAQKVGFKIR